MRKVSSFAFLVCFQEEERRESGGNSRGRRGSAYGSSVEGVGGEQDLRSLMRKYEMYIQVSQCARGDDREMLMYLYAYLCICIHVRVYGEKESLST